MSEVHSVHLNVNAVLDLLGGDWRYKKIISCRKTTEGLLLTMQICVSPNNNVIPHVK